MSSESNRTGFVASKLPWIIGAAALLIFLATLNQWVNLRSLGYVARVTGWENEIPAQWPLFYALTFPFRFLPAAIQPIALNLFSLACATLTVVLLARSVALLPHDRTHDQRIRERSEFSLLTIPMAWAPVVLACGALGLQLTFWENATSFTVEMLNLLCFAYVIRCLLEFRISHRDRWLHKMAFVYGLAVTNNWAMIGFFPLFLGAVVWIKGVRFFDPGFLGRTVLWGVAGLLLYLLLPAVWMMKGENYTFFEILQANWISQKMYLVDQKVYRNRAFLLGLTSVLPVIVMGIRWRTHEGDTNAAASFLTNVAFRVIHLFLLVACVWIAFDPKYSPRALGLNLSYLSFYYLGALAIGYFSGYALLVFTEVQRRGRTRESAVSKLINSLVRVAVLIAAVLVPAGLIYKNFGRVRSENGEVMRDFATRIAQNIPAAPAYLFADRDDAHVLALVQAHLEKAGKASGYIFVNTSVIELPEYHRKLRKRYGDRWPIAAEEEENFGATISQPALQAFMQELVSTNTVAYLHPSFGYFFEGVYPRAIGESYRLHQFNPEQFIVPPLTAEQIAANEKYWQSTMEYMKRLEELKRLKSLDAVWVASYYSRALNTWGVDLLRNDRPKDGLPHFVQAYRLSTNNVPARVNEEYLQARENGTAVERLTLKRLQEEFGEYRTWDQILSANGPFEHPDFCEMLGSSLLDQGQFRQALLQFSRVVEYQPTNFVARLGIARSLAGGNWMPEAMAALDKVEQDFKDLTINQKVEITLVRAGVYFAQQDMPKAEQTLKTARENMPGAAGLAESMFELYRATGNYTNAMAVINEQLSKTPTNTTVHLLKAELHLSGRDFSGAHETLNRALVISPKNAPAHLLQAFAYIQEREYDKAVTVLDSLLREEPGNLQALLYKGIANFEKGDLVEARKAFDSILNQDPNHQLALRNRAVLHLRAKRWGEAKEDYERLRKLAPRSHSVMYGLAEVAAEEGRNADAIRFYEAYLRFAPSDGGPELEQEKKRVQERVQQLRSAIK
jgi:tetratricopeptide (TPR) repeat protein